MTDSNFVFDTVTVIHYNNDTPSEETLMKFGTEIRDALVALETATTDAIRAVDRMNESETDVDALLAGTAVARVGELNQLLFSRIEAAALQMIAEMLTDPTLTDLETPRSWMN